MLVSMHMVYMVYCELGGLPRVSDHKEGCRRPDNAILLARTMESMEIQTQEQWGQVIQQTGEDIWARVQALLWQLVIQKGCIPVPNQGLRLKLKKRFRLQDVDEYRTSELCLESWESIKTQDDSCILYYPTCSSIFVDRDINAASNILVVGTAPCRPSILSRSHTASSQVATGEKSALADTGSEQIKLHIDVWRTSSNLSLISHLECVLSTTVKKNSQLWCLGFSPSPTHIILSLAHATPPTEGCGIMPILVSSQWNLKPHPLHKPPDFGEDETSIRVWTEST